jgi:hypothetical protein
METLVTLDCSQTVYCITYTIELWDDDYEYNEVRDVVIQDWRGVSEHDSLGADLREKIEWLFAE